MPKQRQKRRKKPRSRKVVKKRTVVRRNMQGQGPVGDWFKKTFSKRNLKKANKFLRKNKVISRTAGILDEFGVPHASRVARVSKKLGYGKRKREPLGIKV